MAAVTAAEVAEAAEAQSRQMAAKRKQRSSWTPTGASQAQAVVEVALPGRQLSDVSAL
eukprot:COSAG04_NODE_9350_length_871_cov_2.115285_1_plen_57_part_10